MSPAETQYRKAREKYQSASGKGAANPVVSKRRWRIFLALEAILNAIFVTIFNFGRGSEVAAITSGILGAWLGFTLPIAFLHLVGKDPVFTLCPLIDSAESRAMTREVNQRTPLSEGEFYSRFFDGSQISNDLISRIRGRLKKIDSLSDRLVPTDYLPMLWEELDFAHVFYILNREFRTTIDFDPFDGTLVSFRRACKMWLARAGTQESAGLLCRGGLGVVA